MRRHVLVLAVAVGALVAATAARADGPPPVVAQGGAGVVARDGTHWVAVSDGTRMTLLERVKGGRVDYWFPLKGMWGIPTLGTYSSIGEGLSRDGRTLVLSALSGPYAKQSTFLVYDLKKGRIVRRITLRGSFSFDALSPDASRMYLIQYTKNSPCCDLSHYIVRGYDLRANELLPGRIADRTQKNWVMKGTPVTRAYGAGGRWVYTLYTNPGGYPFIHALDTVRGVAHCIKLPYEEDENQDALYNLVLSARDGNRTLAVDWRSGRSWLNVAVGTWGISYPQAGFPWAWAGTGVGGGLALLGAGVLLLRRRRGQEVHEHARKELGLA